MRVRLLSLVLPILCVTVMPSFVSAAEPTPGASKLLVVPPQAFRDACQADIAQARALAARFKAHESGEPLAVLDEFDSAYALLADASARASLARSVHPDEAVRTAASSCESDVDKANTELTLDRGIYERMAKLDLSKADQATRNYVERTLRDFRRAGVDKDEATRAKIKALREELVTPRPEVRREHRQRRPDPRVWTRRISTACPTTSSARTPPASNGKVTLTTDNTDYQPFMTYATSATARSAFWKLYRQRGAPGERAGAEADARSASGAGDDPRLSDLGRLHHRRQDDRHAPERRRLHRIASPPPPTSAMKADYATVLARAPAKTSRRRRVDAWDSTYYQEQVKAEQYNFDSQAVRPYFEYSTREAGRARHHRPHVRHHVPAGQRRGGVAPDVEAYDVLEGDERCSAASTSTCIRARTSTSTTRSSR